jgi:hypothetical protein
MGRDELHARNLAVVRVAHTDHLVVLSVLASFLVCSLGKEAIGCGACSMYCGDTWDAPGPSLLFQWANSEMKSMYQKGLASAGFDPGGCGGGIA